MAIKQTKIWKCSDDEVFEDQAQAQAHEDEITLKEKVQELLSDSSVHTYDESDVKLFITRNAWALKQLLNKLDIKEP